MTARAERWQRLGIEPGEERVLLAGAVTLFLVEWAAVSVTNVAETFFLKRVGVARLPIVFLVNSFLLAGTSVAVGRLAARGDQRLLLMRVLVLFGLLLLPLWLLVVARTTGAYAVLVVVAKQLDAIAVLVFWTALGGLVSGRQGKRLFGLITAGGTLGTICGSFASAPLARAFGIPTLLPIASLLLALGCLATFPLRRRQPVRARPVRREDASGRRFWALWQGWLFRVLVVSSLLAGVLGPMLYFEFSYVADLATRGASGEQRLLGLYAVIRGWLNVGVLAIQMFGTSALFRRIGVPLAAAVSPVIYLLGLTGLSLGTSLPAGVGAMAGTTLQDHAVSDPAQRILLTLFPERVRATVTALVEGAAKRVGAIAGNLIVIAILAFGAPAWVAWIGLPVAALWLLLAALLWWEYPTLLLAIAGPDRTGAGTPKPLAALLDASTLRGLARSLESPDLASCRAACALVVEASRSRAVATLARALEPAPPANRRLLITALDRILEEEPVLSPAGARQVAALLQEPDGLDPIDVANLVQAYARLLGPAAAEPGWRGPLEKAARDEREAVRLAAVAAICRLERRGDLEGVLATALESDDAATRQIVREELRAELLRRDAEPETPDATRHLQRLAALLEHPDDRPHAAVALADIAERHGARVAAQAAVLLSHRDDHDARVRTAVLRFVGASHLDTEARWAATRLAAPDVAEAAAAQAALRALGPAAVEALCETLRSGRLAARVRALPILRAMSEEEPALQRLIDGQVDASLRLVLQAEVLRAGGASDLVLRRLRERVDENAHTALLLLAATLDDERIDRASELLRSTPGGRERAVLLEALEAVLPAEEAARVLPLLDRERPGAIAALVADGLGSQPTTFDEVARAVVADGDQLTAVLLEGTLDLETRARLQLDRHRASVPYQVGAAAMATVEKLLHLRSLELFERLTTQQLADLATVVEEVTYPAGGAVLTEGEFNDGLFIIMAGEVLVSKAGVTLRLLSGREFFGEMSLLDGGMRSATVTAVDTVRLLRLSRDALLQVMEEQPAIAITICQTLSRRLRDLLEERARLEPKG